MNLRTYFETVLQDERPCGNIDVLAVDPVYLTHQIRQQKAPQLTSL